MDLNLKGKVAMVGGASKGLGFAVARALAADGAQVSIASRNRQANRGRGGADRAGNRYGGAGDRGGSGVAGRRLPAGIGRRSIASAASICCSPTPAAPPRAASSTSTMRAWQSAFELLVLGVVRQVRLVVPSMQARGGGAILMSTSSAVKEPIANIALSNVLRASVAALAKTLALELAGEPNSREPARAGPHRHRSRAGDRCDQREEGRHFRPRNSGCGRRRRFRWAATASRTNSDAWRHFSCRTPPRT